MFVLAMVECERCTGEVAVISYEGVVSHGECIECRKKIVLPQERFIDFVREYCVKYNTVR
jgi:hypothetical protein